MGVQGLWPLLEPTAKPITLDALEGKRLAVGKSFHPPSFHISLWLHQAAQGYSAHGLSSKSPHLALLMHRIAKLLFYKIRPIFVFDGEQVPALKKQVLRERALKRHVDELTLNKRQKALLTQLAQQQVDDPAADADRAALEAQIQQKFAQGRRSDDIFEVANQEAEAAGVDIPKPRTRKPRKKRDEQPNDYLSGYNRLLKEDERITFLLDAKERAKNDRVNPHEIPDDSLEFSHFQLQRLCKRNAVNTELEKLKQEKAAQVGRPSTSSLDDSGGGEMVIVDSHSHGHVLRRTYENEPPRVHQPEGLTVEWKGFLKRIRNEYGEDEANGEAESGGEEEGTSGGFNYARLLQRFAQREAAGLSDGSAAESNDEEQEMAEVVAKAKRCEQHLWNRRPTSSTAADRMEVDEEENEEENPEEVSTRRKDSWTPEQSVHGSEDEAEVQDPILRSSESSEAEDEDFVEVSDDERLLEALQRSLVEQQGPPTKRAARHPAGSSKTRASTATAAKQKTPKKAGKKEKPRAASKAANPPTGDPKMTATSVLPRPEAEDEDAWVAAGVEESGREIREPLLFATAAAAIPDEVAESGVYAECQRLLAVLGLPYMVAPSEAEAQCVCLERLGLCDGIVTDDSDVWLFGGERVYKNMFSRREHVHEYEAAKIYDELGLGRLDFIILAMLAGGDYTRGFEGVGCVTALELLAEVARVGDEAAKKNVQNSEDAYGEGLQRLQRIRMWLDAKPKAEAEAEAAGKPSQFFETKQKIRLRRLIETRNEQGRIENFPSEEVFEAYMRPLVDADEHRFKWTPVEFEAVHEFVWLQLGWSADELRRHTHDALRVWDEFIRSPTQHYQTRLTAFLRRTDLGPATSRPFAPTSRVQQALQRLKKRKGKGKGAKNSKGENGEPKEEDEEEDDRELATLIDRAKRESRARSNKKEPEITPAIAAAAKLPPPRQTANSRRAADDFYDDRFDLEFQQQQGGSSTSAPAARKATKSRAKRPAVGGKSAAAKRKPPATRTPALLRPSGLQLSESSSDEEDGAKK
ncbi:hypothetical protein M3Y99_00657500 [Aphelenchoides fujianensis]|nr:hypothetical protein M3Y99_00657500 [Aphelenchoides fujianensis]